MRHGIRGGLTATTAASVLVGACGVAWADTFSFAADSNLDGPILRGEPTTANTSKILDGSPLNLDGTVIVDFRWDPDEDGPLNPVTIESQFDLLAESTNYSKANFSGIWIHTYTFGGSYEFRRTSDNVLVFSATFAKAVFTTVSAGEFSWGQTASIQSSDSTDPTITFTPGPALGPLDLSQSEDFAFTLTNLRTGAGGQVGVNGSGAPTDTWRSEASWSAQAIPAPGATVLSLIGAGLAVGRRKR